MASKKLPAIPCGGCGVELAGRRVTALDSAANILFRMDAVEADALAVDPITGNVWCAGGSSLDQSELKVFDTAGSRVATHSISGFDIVYSPHDEAFWVAGRDVTKCDREGTIRARLAGTGWATVSVSADFRDGGAWVVERKHPQVKNSVNRLLRLDAQGELVREIDLGTRTPFCVASDPRSGAAWMVEHGTALIRVPVEGPPLDPIPIPAIAISIGVRTGSIWVSTRDAVMKLDQDGRVTASAAFTTPSSQSWLAVP